MIEKLLPAHIRDEFIGFNTSLAPFPSDEHSIANALGVKAKDIFPF